MVSSDIPSVGIGLESNKTNFDLPDTDCSREILACYAAVFSVLTQRSLRGGALRDDTKNGCSRLGKSVPCMGV